MITIGFLATQIPYLQHFYAVTSFCSNLLAPIKDSDEAQKILSNPTKKDASYATWKQEVMELAEKQDMVLKKGQEMQLKLK